MVRLFLLSLVAAFVGTAFAGTIPEQKVLGDATTQLTPSWSYNTECATKDDIIEIKSIQVSPDPPQPGKDLTVTVTGTARETIEDGAYADVTVKLGIIKLLSKTFDICKEARSANITLQCPIEKGDHTVSHTVKLPGEIPQAKFTVSVDGYTKDDDDLLCLDLAVDFRKFPFLW